MGNQKEVQRNFGRRAVYYRYSSTHGNPADLERMIAMLNPASDSVALDVATGGGHTALKLSDHCAKVIAADITEEMLAQARSAAMEKGTTNIEFLQQDVHSLEFHDGAFDIVTSRFAPHHFSDIKAALAELCRVLKSGGKIYIFDCSVVDGDEAEKALNRVEWLRDSSHVFSYSERLWRILLDELPLDIDQVQLYKNEYQLPQWFERMGTPEEKRQEIFRMLNNLSEDCRLQYPFNNDFITTYRVEILATKL